MDFYLVTRRWLSVPSFLFHDELYAGSSGVDSAYVLHEKHYSVVAKKQQDGGGDDSTIHLFHVSQGIGQRHLDQVFVLLHLFVLELLIHMCGWLSKDGFMFPYLEMALTSSIISIHDDLYAGTGVDFEYVLQEKHDAVAEKNTKLEEMMTPLSTSFLSVKVLAKCTCCMMNNAELSSFFFHCGTIPDFVT
jgi:hypothetical protein